MNNVNQVAVWMDHASAHLIENPVNEVENTVVYSKLTHQERENAVERGEKKLHNTEQHEELAFYKKIGDLIRDYKEVLLFGPTEAKTELLNLLRTDHTFSDIKFTIQNTDKMTGNQEQAFVREYFKKTLNKK